MIRALILSVAIAAPAAAAAAGVEDAIRSHIEPGLVAFADATRALEAAAQEDCRPPTVIPAYHDAFDAWMGISHLRIGPLEEGGRAMAIEFWPDVRDRGERAQSNMVADEDPVIDDPSAFARASFGARGLIAMERLLFDPHFAEYDAGSYTCRYVEAIATDLHRMAQGVEAEWRFSYGPAMLAAGDDRNSTFLTRREAPETLYAALLSGIKFNATQRLGQPLGSTSRPSPELAETRQSGRSLRNVVLSLEGLREFAEALAPGGAEETLSAFDVAIQAARDLDDPIFAGVADPAGWRAAADLREKINAIAAAASRDVGRQLGVSQGFSSSNRN